MQIYIRFDAEGFGRDLHLNGDISYAQAAGSGVWLFDNQL